MKTRILSIVALLLMAVTGAWAQTETLLTTLTFGGSSTYSETTSGVVSVTATNVTDYDSTYGWLWYREGSLSITAEEGYTITKCVFRQNAKNPITDTEAPFEIHSSSMGYITEDTKGRMDGVTSIEVYGYANAPAAVNVTAHEGATGEYWSTFYNASQGYTADENTTIYKGSLSGSSLQLTAVMDIAAGQAVILKSTAASITLTPAATTYSDFTGNDLKGGTAVTSGYDAYTLSRGGEGSGTVGFYKFSGSLDGSKAHLEVAQSAGTRSFIGFGDGTTAIEAPAATTSAEGGEWYSLDGRRLSGKPARKGIYVRNGQKFIIK